jgi:hypothetical protein
VTKPVVVESQEDLNARERQMMEQERERIATARQQDIQAQNQSDSYRDQLARDANNYLDFLEDRAYGEVARKADEKFLEGEINGRIAETCTPPKVCTVRIENGETPRVIVEEVTPAAPFQLTQKEKAALALVGIPENDPKAAAVLEMYRQLPGTEEEKYAAFNNQLTVQKNCSGFLCIDGGLQGAAKMLNTSVPNVINNLYNPTDKNYGKLELAMLENINAARAAGKDDPTTPEDDRLPLTKEGLAAELAKSSEKYITDRKGTPEQRTTKEFTGTGEIAGFLGVNQEQYQQQIVNARPSRSETSAGERAPIDGSDTTPTTKPVTPGAINIASFTESGVNKVMSAYNPYYNSAENVVAQAKIDLDAAREKARGASVDSEAMFAYSAAIGKYNEAVNYLEQAKAAKEKGDLNAIQIASQMAERKANESKVIGNLVDTVDRGSESGFIKGVAPLSEEEVHSAAVDFLWENYQKTDFSWKDEQAAKDAGMSMKDFVMGGIG